MHFTGAEMMFRCLVTLALFIAISAPTRPVAAQSSSQTLITESMQQCHLGRIAQARQVRLGHFEKGQALGEQAVALDDRSADAHFAVFCNLGEILRIDGEVSLSSVFGFRRMMKELDRTLDLSPQHLDALSARGTLLVRLPLVLGGDPEKGEHILEHVIQREPQAVNARLSLAKSYCARGRHHDAVTLASEALSLAVAQQRTDFIPEATNVVAQLRAVGNKAN
jgi:hypothetical protein